MEQTEKSLLTPMVKVFFSTRSNSHIHSELVDLSKSPDTITSLEDSRQWEFDLHTPT